MGCYSLRQCNRIQECDSDVSPGWQFPSAIAWEHLDFSRQFAPESRFPSSICAFLSILEGIRRKGAQETGRALPLLLLFARESVENDYLFSLFATAYETSVSSQKA